MNDPLVLDGVTTRSSGQRKLAPGDTRVFSVPALVRKHFEKRRLKIRSRVNQANPSEVTLTLVYCPKGKLRKESPKSKPLADRVYRMPFDRPFFVDQHMAGVRAYDNGHGSTRLVPIHLNTVERRLRKALGYRVITWTASPTGGYYVTKHTE